MLSSKWWNNKASYIKLVYLYSTNCLVCLENPFFGNKENRTWSTALLTGTGESLRWQGNNLATWWNKTEFQRSGHSAIHVWFIGRSPSLTRRFQVTYSSNKDNLQFNIQHAEGAAGVSTPKSDKLRLRPCRIRYFGQLGYLQFRNEALVRPGRVNKHMYLKQTSEVRLHRRRKPFEVLQKHASSNFELSNCVMNGLFWDAHIRSANQKIPYLSRTLKVRRRVHDSQSVALWRRTWIQPT